MPLRRTTHLLAAIGALFTAASGARAETVEVYAAGSLRGALAALSPKASAMGIDLKPVFGGSGELRQRIEHGAKPDLYLSADMASPQALATEGRALQPPVAFARNRLCLVARRSLGITPADLVPRLLAGDIRIRTSKPIADPSGDYAFAMFDRMNAARPGAGKMLRANAEAQMDLSLPTGAGQNTTAALFKAQLIDVAVTYCSATGDLTKNAPDLVAIPVPMAFDPQPVFGMVLLSPNAAAKRLALLLVSDAGQDTIAASGLIPISPSPKG
jgi:molybdate transport system substrate-binding protein